MDKWEFKKQWICPADELIRRRYRKGHIAAHYRIKYDICREQATRRIQPRDTAFTITQMRILEIGVRAGYSAKAFMDAAGPDAMYVGLDAYDLVRGKPRHGGVPNADLTWIINWRDQLRDGHSCEFHKVDTQKQTTLQRFGEFDLIHVDGDHSSPGCQHDLNLALSILRPGGIILVDDFCYLGTVMDAVLNFWRENPVTMQFIDSYRGDVIIRRAPD